MNPRSVPVFDGIVNFRDLGGHVGVDGRRIRDRMFFRSGHLGAASDRDVASLGDLGIRLVVDLRGRGDMAIDGVDRLPDEVEHLNLPMSDTAGPDDVRSVMARLDPDEMARVFGDGRAEALMRSAAASIATQHLDGFGALLSRLSEGRVPALVHCSAGKDRAGWAVAVVLFALGVDVEAVREDYLATNDGRRGFNDERRAAFAAAGVDFELIRPLVEARPAYLDAQLAAVADGWGDIDGYLADGLGFDGARREQLAAHLLA